MTKEADTIVENTQMESDPHFIGTKPTEGAR